MKRSILYATFFLILVSACTMLKKDNIRAFILGMYVRSFEHEFARGSDTLIIQHLSGDSYKIIRRSGFIRIRNGKVLPVEHKKEIWIGIYDEQSKVLNEQQKGKIISFTPANNQLLVGASVYQKVNP